MDIYIYVINFQLLLFSLYWINTFWAEYLFIKNKLKQASKLLKCREISYYDFFFIKFVPYDNKS